MASESWDDDMRRARELHEAAELMRQEADALLAPIVTAAGSLPREDVARLAGAFPAGYQRFRLYDLLARDGG